MPYIEFSIGGALITQASHSPSLSISYNENQRSQMTVRIDSRDNTWTPEVGVEIKAYYKGRTIFGGLIWSVKRKKLSGINHRVNDITAVGFEWLFDRRSTGVRSYSNQYASDIYLDILAQCINGADGADGVGHNYVEPGRGPIIESITFDNPTVTEAFNQIAEVSNMRWYIDAERELQLINPTDLSLISGYIYQNYPGFPNTSNTLVDTFEITETLEQFANRVVVTFKDQPIHEVESFDGGHPSQPTDGVRMRWTMPNPVLQGSIGVEVDGSSRTVDVAGSGVSAEWFYSPGGVDVYQAEGSTPLSNTQRVAFNYWKLGEITIKASNDADIAARATAEVSAGIHEKKIEQTVTGWNLQHLADTILDQIDEPSRRYSWNALLSDWNTLMPGQKVGMRISSEINEDAIIKSVSINEITLDHLEVTVTAVSGPSLKDGYQSLATLGSGSSSSRSFNTPTIISVSEPTDITKFMLSSDDPDDWGVPFNRAIEAAKTTGGKEYLVPARSAPYNFKTPVDQPADSRSVYFRGESDASLLKRIADMPDGMGWINMRGSGLGFIRLYFEGNVLTPVGINYSEFAGDPMHVLLTKNSTFWQHDGAAEFYLEESVVAHTGGYASVANAKTNGVSNLHFRGNRLLFNRPHLFGTDNPDLNYGGWTGGIFVRGDCSGANLGSVVGLYVDDCKFYRGSGNQVWMHSLGFASHHARASVTDSDFDTIARDAVLIGNCDGAVVDNCDIRRIGYVTKTDNDTPDPQALMGNWAVAIDTSGWAEDVEFTRNRIQSVYGGMIDGDGFRKGIIKGNIFDGNWEGIPEIGLKIGVNLGDTSGNGACENIQIVMNQFRHCLQAALRLNHAKNCYVAGNLVVHSPTASEVPIQLWSDSNRCTGNKVEDNLVHWNGANWCIAEVGSFDATNKNQVFNNTCLGTNLGEFLKHTDSRSFSGTSLQMLAITHEPNNDPAADSFGDEYTLIRRGDDGSIEISSTVDSGARVWESMSGVWQKVGVNDAIYYDLGPVIIGQDHEDGSGAALQIKGFANSSVGFATQGTAVDAIQAPEGGAFAKWLIAKSSLTLMAEAEASAGGASAGQGRLIQSSTANLIRASSHGGAWYDVLMAESTVADGTILFGVSRGIAKGEGTFVYKGGKVGIGTSTPAAALHVQGDGIYTNGTFNSGSSGIAFKTQNDKWSADSDGNQSGVGEANFLQGYKINGIKFAQMSGVFVQLLADHFIGTTFNSTATGTDIGLQINGGMLQANGNGYLSGAGESNFVQGYKVNGNWLARYVTGRLTVTAEDYIGQVFNSTVTGSAIGMQINGGKYQADGDGNVSGAGKSNFVNGYEGGSFRGAGVAVQGSGVGGGSMSIYNGSSYLTFAQPISGGVGISAHSVNGTTVLQNGTPISSLYAPITHNHNSLYYTKSEVDGNSFNAFVTHLASYHQTRTINYKDHSGNNATISVYGP